MCWIKVVLQDSRQDLQQRIQVPRGFSAPAGSANALRHRGVRRMATCGSLQRHFQEIGLACSEYLRA
ncbi:hypothetical protein T484DRAFT_1937699 [Baffinella frigidus]|nr:hypothetical protein T484DRAFT_1937699 [Cryptophyta sp. CCMP2293]